MEPQEVIASDRKRLIIDAYAKYRISDPQRFYQSVRTDAGLTTRFSPVLESNIREEVGRVTLVDLLSVKREDVMKKIHEQANKTAANYGINVVDVRIMRTDLPQENSRAIFERMKTQHEKAARQTRAEGAEEALKISSTADKERRILLAEANKLSQILRGEGDSKAIDISAQAFGRDAPTSSGS
jgi:membrane protease subunit HflC